ncbi:hypothetical protein OPV22_015506 [Ensete ventricosum]|uniref:AN1-type domain-containing protein n=1 Tax=Ensete ventricosum TaxID=4639 RepID=A0AAV8R416_ENSVE|nr:hypothetical protein OPV22_015506 [Ensete ventricosum]
MAEEQRCQEGHRLCANNCGFLGSPATLNLCPKCYRDHRLKEEEQRQAASHAANVAVAEKPPHASSSASAAAPPAGNARAPPALASPAAAGPSRCAMCRKRVGLTGFRCRCGATHCGAHRHAEQHGCTFDFKAAGREAIARANPVVKADKLNRI